MSEGTQRRLAAILAADVAGYSRLMGDDQADTLSALRKLRTETFTPTVERHRGRIVKVDRQTETGQQLVEGLDAGTAFEILSIDIADVDVGANIGAKLNTERAEADKQVAQAAAEGRRALYVSGEESAAQVRARADRLGALAHLLPPRTAGTRALLAAAPEADVVVGWHVGFEGLDTFGGILEALSGPRRDVHIEFRRVARTEVPGNDDFTEWLDRAWLELDGEVYTGLSPALALDGSGAVHISYVCESTDELR